MCSLTVGRRRGRRKIGAPNLALRSDLRIELVAHYARARVADIADLDVTSIEPASTPMTTLHSKVASDPLANSRLRRRRQAQSPDRLAA